MWRRKNRPLGLGMMDMGPWLQGSFSYPWLDRCWPSVAGDSAGLWIMAGLVFVFFRTFPVPGPGVVQAIAFTIHLEDRDMVHETIEWCAGQPFRLRPARRQKHPEPAGTEPSGSNPIPSDQSRSGHHRGAVR